jgi:hypothetical protein
MDDEQIRILRAMTPAQKIRAAERLIESARELKAAAIRARHPDWSDEQVREAVAKAFLNART